jgi:hypothetical protein
VSFGPTRARFVRRSRRELESLVFVSVFVSVSVPFQVVSTLRGGSSAARARTTSSDAAAPARAPVGSAAYGNAPASLCTGNVRVLYRRSSDSASSHETGQYRSPATATDTSASGSGSRHGVLRITTVMFSESESSLFALRLFAFDD